MSERRQHLISAAATGLLLIVAVPAATDGNQTTAYIRTDLVSNLKNLAQPADPNLQNAWGVASTPDGPLWVADNNDALSTLYDGNSVKVNLTVTIPLPCQTHSAAGGGPDRTGVEPDHRLHDHRRRGHRTGDLHLRHRGRHDLGLESDCRSDRLRQVHGDAQSSTHPDRNFGEEGNFAGWINAFTGGNDRDFCGAAAGRHRKTDLDRRLRSIFFGTFLNSVADTLYFTAGPNQQTNRGLALTREAAQANGSAEVV
jgi:hypothetical protein